MSRSSILLYALPLFAATSSTGAGAEAPILNVRDFGAVGDGRKDDAPAINRAFAAGVRSGPGTTVVIPGGRYRLGAAGGRHVEIQGAKGLTVRGEPGAVLVASDPEAPIFSLSRCEATTVRALVLDQEKTYFTQGTIEAVSADGKSCEASIDRRYDEPDAPHLANLSTLRSFSYSDTTAYRQDRWWPTVKGRTKIGDRAWRLDIEGWAVTPDMAKKPFILWDDKHGSHGFQVDGCSGCTIEDVDYHGRGTNAGLFIVNCPGTITMRRFNILAAPGSDGLLSCSGGGQMIDCRGSLVFEECRFDKVDDDGADILTGYDRVLSQADPRALKIEGRRDYRPGDRVAIVDWSTREDRHSAAVVDVARNADGTTTLRLDRDVTTVRVGPGGGKDRTGVNSDGIDRVVNYNLACESATFRRCKIQALRARGLNLKAQNCLIEDCTFYDCEMPAVSGGAEFWWGEGPAIRNFTVRNNRFVNCNTRCVDIAYFDAGEKCTARENRDILIEGNTFTHWANHGTIHRGFTPQCPIRIGNADGVVIRGNRFEEPGSAAKSTLILIENSGKVTLEGNVNLPAGSIERR